MLYRSPFGMSNLDVRDTCEVIPRHFLISMVFRASTLLAGNWGRFEYLELVRTQILS